MKTKLWVGGILLLFALYIGMTFTQAFRLIGSDVLIAQIMGVAILVIPALCVWILIREVLFGLRTEKMGKSLASTGELPKDLPRKPSGRIIRAAADEDFPNHQRDVEENPESWKSWYRLALAYEACGDKGRARSSMRTAIGFWRQAEKSASNAR